MERVCGIAICALVLFACGGKSEASSTSPSATDGSIGTEGDAGFDPAHPPFTVSAGNADAAVMLGSVGCVLSPMFIGRTALEVVQLTFHFSGMSGSWLIGSKGTNYFTNIRLLNAETNVTIDGPVELPVTANATNASMTFAVATMNDAFNVPTTMMLNTTLCLHVSATEDAPGEMTSGVYAVSITSDAEDMVVLEGNRQLTDAEFHPSKQVFVNSFTADP